MHAEKRRRARAGVISTFHPDCPSPVPLSYGATGRPITLTGQASPSLESGDVQIRLQEKPVHLKNVLTSEEKTTPPCLSSHPRRGQQPPLCPGKSVTLCRPVSPLPLLTLTGVTLRQTREAGKGKCQGGKRSYKYIQGQPTLPSQLWARGHGESRIRAQG